MVKRVRICIGWESLEVSTGIGVKLPKRKNQPEILP
jgi:hypothetical protein